MTPEDVYLKNVMQQEVISGNKTSERNNFNNVTKNSDGKNTILEEKNIKKTSRNCDSISDLKTNIKVHDTIFTERKKDHTVNFVVNNLNYTSNELPLAEKREMRRTRFGHIKIGETTGSNQKQIVINNKKQEIKSPSLNKANKSYKFPKRNSFSRQGIILPKEEIEARLRRFEKYGTGNHEKIDELKAMLRSYRFKENS